MRTLLLAFMMAMPAIAGDVVWTFAKTPDKCVKCGFSCQCGTCKCPQALVSNAGVKESDDKPVFLKPGTKFQVDGWWYTTDGAGRGHWCEECNGCTLEQAKAQVARQSARPTQPGWRPGQSDTRVILVQPVAGASTSLPASMRTGRTVISVGAAVQLGGINFGAGCSAGG